jgi:ankyrin repeat protein
MKLPLWLQILDPIANNCLSELPEKYKNHYKNFLKVVVDSSPIQILNVCDEKGGTALHYAIQNFPVSKYLNEFFMFLLELKPNLDCKNQAGETPLHLCATIGMDYSFGWEQLIKSGAKLNLQDNKNQTPLHIAISNKKLLLATCLLEHNADVTITSNDGTPLELVGTLKEKLTGSELEKWNEFYLVLKERTKQQNNSNQLEQSKPKLDDISKNPTLENEAKDHQKETNFAATKDVAQVNFWPQPEDQQTKKEKTQLVTSIERETNTEIIPFNR